jgi:hypothetical protein
MSIDAEWETFMSSANNDEDVSSDEEEIYDPENTLADEFVSANIAMDIQSTAPKASGIYISTKTKIAYLNTPIDLKTIFWDIPLISYSMPTNGVIKKQMKFNSTEKEEVEFIQNKIKDEPYFEENIITHIDNPAGRIKYKDIRKVSIGIAKKDILSYRCKKKSAFYNCFVLILRLKIGVNFKEFHVKVFNTGKIEIPGIQSDDIYHLILDSVLSILQPYVSVTLGYKPDSNETVLINSNFNCGFYINREALNDILKMKYNIQAIYDPCSYPGIQCKYYYYPGNEIQNGCQITEEHKEETKEEKKLNKKSKNYNEVSFMIFRTGSVLIVGKCDENVLMIIYNFLTIVLNNEYHNICQKYSSGDTIKLAAAKDKTKKTRRKNIIVEFSSEAI